MRPALLPLVLFLAGCAGVPSQPEQAPEAKRPGGYYKDDGPGETVPDNLAAIPDAQPRVEPLNRFANRPYEVFGKRYVPLASVQPFRQRGLASWYGKRFHGQKTSSGERYDMYGMTAAHKTLPLPTYARVTNLRNGRSVVVRVNDRGPFKDGRIIDLSYTAASKLDMLKDGTTFVEVRALTPEQKAAPPAPPPAPEALYVQAGAFASESNAARLQEQLRTQGVEKTFIREDRVDGRTLYRVRVGPIPSVNEFDRVLARLRSLGLSDAQLAAD